MSQLLAKYKLNSLMASLKDDDWLSIYIQLDTVSEDLRNEFISWTTSSHDYKPASLERARQYLLQTPNASLAVKAALTILSLGKK